MKYATIVADPPWEIKDRGRAGYPFMALPDIMALPVEALAADQAHLYLWSTRRNFREGVAAAVARAWGFEPCGEILWGLRNPGLGGMNGNGHEPVLLAARGGLAWPKNLLPQGVVFWRQPYLLGKIHSAKPEGFLDLVESMSPEPRLEMFARRNRIGWHTWGNEALEHVAMVPDAP